MAAIAELRYTRKSETVAHHLSNSLAVINCSQVVTLAGAHRPRTGGDLRQLAIIEDGAMLVRGDRIEAVGRRREIEALTNSECEVIDAGRRVVLPGFVDAHTHPVFAGNRANEFEQRTAGATYREIARGGGGIRATVRATRNASLNELVKAGKRYAEWFLRVRHDDRRSEIWLRLDAGRRTENPACDQAARRRYAAQLRSHFSWRARHSF